MTGLIGFLFRRHVESCYFCICKIYPTHVPHYSESDQFESALKQCKCCTLESHAIEPFRFTHLMPDLHQQHRNQSYRNHSRRIRSLRNSILSSRQNH